MTAHSLPIGKLNLGKVDGKHEYLTPRTLADERAFDAYLLPESVDPDRLHNGDVCFIEGFRGTGKTSMLRWHAQQRRRDGCFTKFVLFKSDLNESQRLLISKEVGIDWADIDATSMEIAQDFKTAWTWFILHKIGEAIAADESLATGDVQPFLRLMGLADEPVFTKSIGFMPRLEGASVKLKGDLGFFNIELGGDFKAEGQVGRTTLDALSQAALRRTKNLKFNKETYIYFDELEVFYALPEQYRRDQRMVRDLIFSVAALNERFREDNTKVHLIAAVRSEVVDQMGSLGQEVDRLVHDRGFVIAWHHSKRSLAHPLLRMISRKIQASEQTYNSLDEKDVFERYFPEQINGTSIDAFLLDRSFYKPRDLVWRLSLAQKLFPSEEAFSQEVLFNTENEYSAKLWDEIRYELSAAYAEGEIDIIESVLSGGARSFDLETVTERFTLSADRSPSVALLLARKSVVDILNDLYRLGAIGNAFRAGTSASDMKNRWAFRGDSNLLVDKRMEIHAALIKRLSAVSARRRGPRSEAAVARRRR